MAYVSFSGEMKSVNMALNINSQQSTSQSPFFSDQPMQVQAVVVVLGVIGLGRVDEEQSGSQEMSSVACSSEIEEDGLRFIERQCGDHQPLQSRWF